jgi:hypothetical protein
MRVEVGKKLRVGPGDEITIRGYLPPTAKLGRLFVFASEGGAEFSPYVLNAADMLVANGRPTMLSPLSLRLTEHYRERDISFTADITGYVRVMQEIDNPQDPRAIITMTRTINPNLGWIEWAQRKFIPWPMPNPTS